MSGQQFIAGVSNDNRMATIFKAWSSFRNARLPCATRLTHNQKELWQITLLERNHVNRRVMEILKWKKIDFLLWANEKKNACLGKCFQSGNQFFFTKIFILPFSSPRYQDMLLSQVNQHNDKDDDYHGDRHSNHHWRHNWTRTSSCRSAWFGRVAIIGTGNNGAQLGNN